MTLIERAFAGTLRAWSVAAEEKAESLPLAERLTMRWFEDSGGCRKSWPRNPDGPEAAAELEANAAEIGRLREALVEAWKRVNEYGYCGPTYRKVRQHWAEQLLINIDAALNKQEPGNV